MINFFKKIAFWVYVKIHGILINISIALHNTEVDILKADPNIYDEKDKKIQRKRHRNEILEKFYAGQTDEKYIQEYYEILKKADNFIKNSTYRKIAMTADKHIRYDGVENHDDSSNVVKDKYGRRVAHYGFFDEKHKYYGKTLAEVIEIEKKERRTNDDDFELIYIFNNKPYELGIVDVFDIVNEQKNDMVVDVQKISKKFKFPIKIYRDNDNIINKIEEITEYLHVKRIGFEFRQLEFFIPLHFKINEVKNDSDVFKELTNIKSVFINDDYGNLIGFTINKFVKRINYNNTYEVWKFEGVEMDVIKTNL